MRLPPFVLDLGQLRLVSGRMYRPDQLRSPLTALSRSRNLARRPVGRRWQADRRPRYCLEFRALIPIVREQGSLLERGAIRQL